MKKLVILIFAIVPFFSGCDNKNEPKNENVEDLNYIIKNIENYYPFLDFKNINTDSLYNAYLPLVKNASKSNLSNIYVGFLSELKDGHANVIQSSGYPIYAYKIPRREKDMESFKIELVKSYLGKEFKEFDNLYKYEILPGNIGYIYYSSFSGELSKYEKLMIFWNT